MSFSNVGNRDVCALYHDGCPERGHAYVIKAVQETRLSQTCSFLGSSRQTRPGFHQRQSVSRGSTQFSRCLELQLFGCSPKWKLRLCLVPVPEREECYRTPEGRESSRDGYSTSVNHRSRQYKSGAKVAMVTTPFSDSFLAVGPWTFSNIRL